MNLDLHLFLSFFSVYATLSLLEYFAHRYVMHRQRLAKLFRSQYMYASFREHMAHHGPCYDVFNHEDRPCGLLNLTIKPITELVVVVIPALLTALIDPITAGMLVAGALIHGVLWSAVHSEMHRPQATWFSETFVFRFLARAHYLHHRHPNSNFNTLFLGWDFIFGTLAVETSADRKEIEEKTWRVRGRGMA